MITTIDIKSYTAEGINPKVSEVYRSLKQYAEAKPRQDWLKRRKEAWKAAIDNEMWTDQEEKEMKDMGQVPLVINRLNKGIQGSAAIITDSKPAIQAHPVGSGDLYVAELLKRAVDYVWERNQGNDVIYDGVMEAKIGGLAFFDVCHDPSLGMFGRCNFEECPPDDIYFDAESRTRDYSDTHLIKAKLRTKSYIKDRYDNITDDDLKFADEIKELKEGATSSGITGGDNYAEGLKADQPSITAEEERNIWEIEAWMLKVVSEFWVMIGPDEAGQFRREVYKNKARAVLAQEALGNAVLWPRKVQKRVLRHIVGKKLIPQMDQGQEVDERENPYGIDADGVPVMPLISLPHQRTLTAYPMSPTNYAIDINREKNKRRSQFIFMASMDSNAPIMEPEGKVKWTGNPGTPGSRGKYAQDVAPGAVYRLTGGGMNTINFIQLEAKADADIDDQYDLHDVMRGKLPPGSENIAGRTVLALQDMGGMMSKPFLRALESAMVRLAKVIVTIILQTWQRNQWERLIEEDEIRTWMPDKEKTRIPEGQTPDEAMIQSRWMQALNLIRPQDLTKPPGIGLIDMDVRITAGSSMPTNRIARAGMAIEMAKAGIYDAEAALEYIDDPQKDKVTARMKQREQQMIMAGIQKGVK